MEEAAVELFLYRRCWERCFRFSLRILSPSCKIFCDDGRILWECVPYNHCNIVFKGELCTSSNSNTGWYLGVQSEGGRSSSSSSPVCGACWRNEPGNLLSFMLEGKGGEFGFAFTVAVALTAGIIGRRLPHPSILTRIMRESCMRVRLIIVAFMELFYVLLAGCRVIEELGLEMSSR